LGGDGVKVVDGGCAEDVEDDGELVVIWWEGDERWDDGRGTDEQSLPGKSGFPLSISARTQPTDQMSMAQVYSLNVSMTSGARYHLGREG
jgi:hypothetical protein